MKMPSELPTDITVLHKLVLEQNEMIRSLREQLLLALRRQFGPRNEQVNIDQLTLFSDGSDACDLPPADIQEPSKDASDTSGKGDLILPTNSGQPVKRLFSLQSLPG